LTNVLAVPSFASTEGRSGFVVESPTGSFFISMPSEKTLFHWLDAIYMRTLDNNLPVNPIKETGFRLDSITGEMRVRRSITGISFPVERPLVTAIDYENEIKSREACGSARI
jgi:hypothetical protein